VKYFQGPVRHIGWLFVLATVAGVLSVLVLGSTLGADDVLATGRAESNSYLLGQMLIFLMLAAMAGTAALLWPILNRHNETLAMGYVLARTLEGVTLTVGFVVGLLLLPLSWSTDTAAGSELTGADTLAETLKAASDWSGYLGAQMVFALSALVLNWIFFRYRLVPRWLSVWGLIGVPLMFASGLLVMIESLNSSASTLNLLVIPLAVQEMAMAAWMIVKGFDDHIVDVADKQTAATGTRTTVRVAS